MCGNLVDRNQPVEDFSSKLIRSECWRRTGSGWRSGDGRQDGTGPHSRSTADDRASNSDSAASPTGAKTKKTSHPFASFIILNDAGARAGGVVTVTVALLCRCFRAERAVLSAVCVLPGLGTAGNRTASSRYKKHTHMVPNPPLIFRRNRCLDLHFISFFNTMILLRPCPLIQTT